VAGECPGISGRAGAIEPVGLSAGKALRRGY